MRKIVFLVIVFVLAGCASYVENSLIPEGYTGETASISDSFQRQSKSRATFFYLYSTDGKSIENSLSRSAFLSDGQGAKLTTGTIIRQAPTKPITVLLKSASYNPQLISSILSKKKNLTFEKELSFTPEPGKRYIVRGELTEEKKSIWIEEYLGKKVAQSDDIDTDSVNLNPNSTLSRSELFLKIQESDPKEYIVSTFGEPDNIVKKKSNFLTGKPAIHDYEYDGLGIVRLEAPNKYDIYVKEIIPK